MSYRRAPLVLRTQCLVRFSYRRAPLVLRTRCLVRFSHKRAPLVLRTRCLVRFSYRRAPLVLHTRCLVRFSYRRVPLVLRTRCLVRFSFMPVLSFHIDRPIAFHVIIGSLAVLNGIEVNCYGKYKAIKLLTVCSYWLIPMPHTHSYQLISDPYLFSKHFRKQIQFKTAKRLRCSAADANL